MIKIYTTPTCGHCKNAMRYFTEQGIDFQEIKVNSQAVAKELQELAGAMSVPLIMVGDKKMLGWDKTKFDELYKGAL